MKFLLLGASGGVGRRILAQGRQRGHTIRAQTRDATKLAGLPSGIEVVAADPADAVALGTLVAGQNAVVIALGTAPGRRTTLRRSPSPSLSPKGGKGRVSFGEQRVLVG
jgi:putative NADH-flavin reductase